MAPFFSERAAGIAEATGAEVTVEHVRNEFYGEVVTTAGLLAGEDILAHLRVDSRPDDLILLPAESLNRDRLFIDSMPIADFAEALAPAQIVDGYDLPTLLHRAAAGETVGSEGYGETEVVPPRAGSWVAGA